MILGSLHEYQAVSKNFMPAQKCRIEMSIFWPKLTFLLKQQIKFLNFLAKSLQNGQICMLSFA